MSPRNDTLRPLLTHHVTRTAQWAVDPFSIAQWCSAVEDANPLHHGDPATMIAPSAMAGVWTQEPVWRPDGTPGRAMELHHRLKELLGLPTAVVRDITHRYGRPVRVGDLLTATHRITEVGPPRRSRAGLGRDWTVHVQHTDQYGRTAAEEDWRFHGYRPDAADADAGHLRRSGAHGHADDARPAASIAPLAVSVDARRIVMAAAASRDWTRFHHDREAAVAAGMPDIILNTPGHTALISRWLVENAVPGGRILRLTLRLRRPVVPGAAVEIGGEATGTTPAPGGCRVTYVRFTERAAGSVTAVGSAAIAGPASSGRGDPWRIPPHAWQNLPDHPDTEE
ncbi:MaoC/PaaZ C-terminal domain-containing protein [Tomitella gaofuii]|uniref:MaoC/PaaZ C-terminal domain-containing protein n=1 Tax=Tomitella gaofuii TaxID=2760083 RepID=UPI0015FE2877|nr:MaoC/PaaZ C-terminal domain-containing protein [Tomitella gaofuii]